VYAIEDPKVIDLCIKRLGLSHEEFDSYMLLEPKTFRDYNTMYNYIRLAKPLIYLFARLHLIPRITYDKYFNCGK